MFIIKKSALFFYHKIYTYTFKNSFLMFNFYTHINILIIYINYKQIVLGIQNFTLIFLKFNLFFWITRFNCIHDELKGICDCDKILSFMRLNGNGLEDLWYKFTFFNSCCAFSYFSRKLILCCGGDNKCWYSLHMQL